MQLKDLIIKVSKYTSYVISAITVESYLRAIDKLREILGPSSDNTNVNSLISNDIFSSLKEFYFEIQNHLNILTLSQKGALFHIFISLAMLFSLLTLFSVFYGEYFIQRFKLEEKYPKLSRFIKFRSKFQHYYFILNTILIILSLLLIIFVNCLVFIIG